MKIAPRQVTVRELVSDYCDDGEGGGDLDRGGLKPK